MHDLSTLLNSNNTDNKNMKRNDWSRDKQETTASRNKMYSWCLTGCVFMGSINLGQQINAVHKKQRSHKCDSCEKGFGQKGNSSEHIVTVHEGQRPQESDFHETAFRVKGNLGKHQKSVSSHTRIHKGCERCNRHQET